MSKIQDWKEALEGRQKFLSLLEPIEEFMRPYQATGDFKDLYSEILSAMEVTAFGITTCEVNIVFAKQRENHGN
jgi:hypothetical protein